MSEELHKLEQLFDAALELASPEERADFLTQACGTDTALRQRVEKFLRAHETAGHFLDPETPPAQTGLPFSESDLPPSEEPGDQIGHYTLVERIGEGGCCVVYRAEQVEPVRRQVALKLIKVGMDTQQVVARFGVERQALALMDHPHIAKVFDAGVSTTGRPYFVMELVRGIPIAQYCDEHRLTVKQRLELFMQVCHAVQHAHQKGVIHRDLKPSNILVTTSLLDEGRRGDLNSSPPSQTGRADFPHPAFRSVAPDGLAQALVARRSEATHQPRKLALRSPLAGRPTGHRQPAPRRVVLAPTRSASRHYVGPGERVALRRSPPLSYVPSLHGRYPLRCYYGRSDPGRPFRRRPPWFPDSRLADFPPCCLQPSAVLCPTRSTSSAPAALFCSGFAVSLAGSPKPPTESSSRCGGSTTTALRPGRFPPDALHPGISPRCSFVRILALQCRPGQGLSPCCQRALSGALGRVTPCAPSSERQPSGGAHGVTRPTTESAEETRASSRRLLRTKESIRSLRGDLDWIVMKALEKDRQRRYETANDLAEDIQRHLAHEPVLAGPPSAMYRMRKFVRRHRIGVAVATAITLSLVAGLSLALVGLHRALQAEAAARREQDRAVQAEADTRRMLELFSDKLAADDEMIGLLHTAARLARERLGPTNPATLDLTLPLAPNFGRLGAWTNALDLYLSLIDADPGNSDYWQCAHAAALAAGNSEASRSLRQGMVARFAAGPDLTHRQRLAKALLLPAEEPTHMETALECARQAAQARPNDAACQSVMGMAEYRRGNWPASLKWLQEAERSTEPNVAALAYCFGAMARQRLGQPFDAREALDRAARRLRLPLQMGQLQAKDWHEAAFALAARAEAERLILGQEVSPPVTAEFMALARERWKSVHEVLARGEALAGQGKWKESRDAYALALAHPLFDWGAEEEESLARCLSIQMGTVFARAGDAANHERLSRLLLALHPEKPMTPKEDQDATIRANRYARTCFLYARSLSPELRQAALELARFAVASQRQRHDHSTGWVCQTGGIAEYYAGQPERALELLLEAEKEGSVPIRSTAMLFRAMVLKKLNRSQEAARVLQDAEVFSTSPDLHSTAWWINGEPYRLALEEARELIRTEAR